MDLEFLNGFFEGLSTGLVETIISPMGAGVVSVCIAATTFTFIFAWIRKARRAASTS